MSFVKFFDQLSSTTKITEKKAILAGATADEKRLLQIALDRQQNYYVTGVTVKMPADLAADSTLPAGRLLESFEQLTAALSQRTVTGYAAIEKAERFFLACTPDEARILSKILFREALGVDAKLVNSVHKNLIPEFNVQLAPNELPADLAKDVTYPKMIQPKLDGFRCITFVNEDGSVDMVTRNGKTIKNPILVEKVSRALREFRGFVFDGEIYRHGWKLKKIQSVANTEELEDGSVKAKESMELTLNLWDVMSSTEWAAQKTVKPYASRYADLGFYLQNVNPVVKLVESAQVADAESAKALNRRHLADGFEGSMLKDPWGAYAWKRSTLKQQLIVKVKEFLTGDFEIIGCELGDPTGKYANTLGRFTISLRGYPVGVGSGIDDDERDEYWAKRDEMIGKVIEVRYFEEIETNGKPSLWHPTFLRLREDK